MRKPRSQTFRLNANFAANTVLLIGLALILDICDIRRAPVLQSGITFDVEPTIACPGDILTASWEHDLQPGTECPTSTAAPTGGCTRLTSTTVRANTIDTGASMQLINQDNRLTGEVEMTAPESDVTFVATIGRQFPLEIYPSMEETVNVLTADESTTVPVKWLWSCPNNYLPEDPVYQSVSSPRVVVTEIRNTSGINVQVTAPDGQQLELGPGATVTADGQPAFRGNWGFVPTADAFSGWPDPGCPPPNATEDSGPPRNPRPDVELSFTLSCPAP